VKTGQKEGRNLINLKQYYGYRQKAHQIKGLEQNNLTSNLSKWLHKNRRSKWADKLLDCGQKWLPFYDSFGCEMYVQLPCKLPICPKCGKVHGAYSRERSERVKRYLLGFPQLGYLTGTIPKELSASMPSSDTLIKLKAALWDIAREFFDAEGLLIVPHFTGDHGSSLHVHFNGAFPILYRNGDCFFPQAILDLAGQEWTRRVNKICGTNYPLCILNYSFKNEIGQIHGFLDYISRSTLEGEKFIELSDAEKEYCLTTGSHKQITCYGKLATRKGKEYLERFKCLRVFAREIVDPIEEHICPIHNEKMKPGKWCFLDDIPLTNCVKYNDRIYIPLPWDLFLKKKAEEKISCIYGSLDKYFIAIQLGLTD
jgi:hypothetical protein